MVLGLANVGKGYTIAQIQVNLVLSVCGLFAHEEKCSDMVAFGFRKRIYFIALKSAVMTFNSLSPFIPSGKDFEQSKKLFLELGFKINWDSGDYVGFQRDNSQFILQKFDDKRFAENLMVSVSVSSAQEFWDEVNTKEIAKNFNVRFSAPAKQPYGIEVNLIDLAGVCWHFVE